MNEGERVEAGQGTPEARAQALGLETSGADQDELCTAWARRFAFFDQHGSPLSKNAQAAAKRQSMTDRYVVHFNIWAFLLGILYFIYLGIPKRGVGIFAMMFLIFVLLFGIDLFAVPHWYGIVAQAIFGSTANYYYYIKVRHGRDEWNPFKDLVH